MSARIIILTGQRESGKTTVCQKTVTRAREAGYSCGGILTSAPDKDTRDVIDIRSNTTRRLTLPQDTPGGIQVGRFVFDPQVIKWGNNALANAVPTQLLIIDEIGPLELKQKSGWTKAFSILHSGHFCLALVIVRPELVMHAQIKMPANAMTVMTVTTQNRDALPDIFCDVIAKDIKPCE